MQERLGAGETGKNKQTKVHPKDRKKIVLKNENTWGEPFSIKPTRTPLGTGWVNRAGLPVTRGLGVDAGKYYCGLFTCELKSTCGPTNGPQCLQCVSLPVAPSEPPVLSQRATPRRLFWCHHAGSVTLKITVTVPPTDAASTGAGSMALSMASPPGRRSLSQQVSLGEKSFFVSASTPQVCVLWAVLHLSYGCPYSPNAATQECGDERTGVERRECTIGAICSVTGLTTDEAQTVLQTLTQMTVSGDSALLQRTSDISPTTSPSSSTSRSSSASPSISRNSSPLTATYHFTEAFLNGRMSATSASSPLILPSLDTSSSASGASGGSSKHQSFERLQEWKNELIDAALVRILKSVMRNKSGAFSNGPNIPTASNLVALPLDMLAPLVQVSANNANKGV